MNVILFAAFSALSFFKIRWAAIIFPFLCFFTPKGLALVDVGGLPYLSLNRALVLVLVFAWLADLFFRKKLRLQRISFPFKSAFLFLALSFFLTLVSNPEKISSDIFTGVISYLEIFFPAYIVYYNVRDRFLAKSLLYRLVILGLFVALYGTFCYVVDVNPFFDYLQSTAPSQRVTISNYEDSLRGVRAIGTFSHPITYGAFLGIMFFSAFMLLRDKASFLRKVILYFSLPVFLVAVWVTNSRTPLVMIVVGLFVYWVASSFKNKLRTLVFLLLVSAPIVYFAGDAVDKVVDAITSVASTSSNNDWNGSTIEMRLQQLAIAIDVFLQNPITGGGFSMTRSLIGSYGYDDLYNAESAFYQWSIDLGILGVLAFLGLLLSIFLNINKSASKGAVRAVFWGAWSGYVLFILATGVMETMQFFLIFMVIALRAFPAEISKSVSGFANAAGGEFGKPLFVADRPIFTRGLRYTGGAK